MAATQVAMQQDPRDVVHEMTVSMASFAAIGEWQRVEEIAARLKQAVMAVPEAERREALLEAQRSMQQVETLAQEARVEVSGKLSALKRGQHATKAYEAID